VAATVAYVAPISFAAPDDRYTPFFDTVGSADCRAALASYARELLVRRAAMVERLSSLATRDQLTFERSGGIEGAFEDAVAGFSWGFWQYYGAPWCSALPDDSASDDQLWSTLTEIGDIAGSSDAEIEPFVPYYYQSETQLGYPAGESTAPLDDLLVTEDLPRDYLPAGATATYDPSAMTDIDRWVKRDGERLLFIYGEFDPWSGGMFELGDAQDSFRLVAAAQNHGASIAALAPDDRATAYDALERWTGVTPEPPQPQAWRASRLATEPPPRHLRPPRRR